MFLDAPIWQEGFGFLHDMMAALVIFLAPLLVLAKETIMDCQKGDNFVGVSMRINRTNLSFKGAALDCPSDGCLVKTAVRNKHVQQLGSTRNHTPLPKGEGDLFLLTCLFIFCRDCDLMVSLRIDMLHEFLTSFEDLWTTLMIGLYNQLALLPWRVQI